MECLPWGQESVRIYAIARVRNRGSLFQSFLYRELKQRRRRRQRERQKSSRFRLAKQQICTCITLFSTFLCRHCTTTTWNFLFSRFVEDVNTRQRPSFSFTELRYSLLEFNSRKICHYLTNWTAWSKRDKVWLSANSLFKWRFRSYVSLGGWLLSALVGCPQGESRLY